MPLLIPVAKDRTGETVTPTCSKEDGPFTCLGCSNRLILRQGETNRWHFAHNSKDNDECYAGGKSYNHLAAKLLLARFISRFEFTRQCDSLLHDQEDTYQDCTAVQEHRFDGVHSADVGVIHDGNLKAIVEVMASHKTEGGPLSARISCVGGENVWEVDALSVLKEQRQLTLTTNTIQLHSLLKLKECAKCALEVELRNKEKQEQMVKEVALATERTAKQKEHRETLEAALRGPTENPVVIIDDNMLLRNNVKMKKVFLASDDWFDRRYIWKKAPHV